MASVDSLMIKFGVSPAACNAKISDIHILDISQKYCSKWRDLPTPLGLNKMAANDLAYAPGDEGGKRKQFLERWQQEKGSDATYRALITALLSVNSRDEAESVCMLLQGTGGTAGTAVAAPQVQATSGAAFASAGQPQDETAAAFQHYASSLCRTAASYLDQTLDWETKGVDKHISEISNVAMIDWEVKLAPVMGLTDVEISDLKRNTTGGAVLLRRAVLKKWKQKAAFKATYRNLLTLCCEAKDFATAQAIIDVLNKKAGGAAPTPAPIQPAAVTPQPAAPTAEPTPKPAETAPTKEGTPTLLQLCNDLKPLASQWKFIGELLELKAEDIKDVVDQEGTLGSTKCLMKVVKIWMEKGNPPVSWDTIKGIKEFL